MSKGTEEDSKSSISESESLEPTTIRVAILGTGLAGLATAYKLSKASTEAIRYEVHLFDERTSIGFDASSVKAVDKSGNPVRVDVPMRSFAGGYYRRAISFYKSLGLEFYDAKFSYSFSELDTTSRSAKTYFLHGGRKGTFSEGGKPVEMTWLAYLFSLIAVAFTFVYFTLVANYARPRGGLSFENEYCSKSAEHKRWCEDIEKHAGGEGPYGALDTGNEGPAPSVAVETLEQYARRWNLSKTFMRRFVVPLFCAVSTCDASVVLAAPASDIIDYKRTTFRQPHYLLRNNSISAVSALLAALDSQKDQVHLGQSVSAMLCEPTGQWTIRTAGGTDYSNFNHVVMAMAPRRICQLYTPLEKILASVQACMVRVLVHTDDRVLDYMRAEDVRDLNLLTDPLSGRTEATHVLKPGVYQTTSPLSLGNLYPGVSKGLEKGNNDAKIDHKVHTETQNAQSTPIRIDTSKILSESTFERVVRTPSLVDAVEELRTRQGRGNVWVAASWMWQGLVLLEGCLTSAESVSDGILARA
ncbi:uncharacterized protein V1516DRAFT_682120 [Lipomyces oligophaga]|uniref:uncharacterized protein n=1 Tax=Lipomyces oligophaga TaxID=45792 RepID=UPI0034D01474